MMAMNKAEFLAKLRIGLSGLPQDDIEERLAFYSEMIEDRTDEGLSEDEAVAAVGSVSDIISQTVADIPLSKIAKERITPKRRLKAWEIVLLALGSPIWLSLGIVAAAVIFAVYAAVWSVLISLWAIFILLLCASFSAVAAGIVFICTGNAHTGIAMVGAALVTTGLSVFTFYGCKAATKGIWLFTKKLAAWSKNIFIKKGEA